MISDAGPASSERGDYEVAPMVNRTEIRRLLLVAAVAFLLSRALVFGSFIFISQMTFLEKVDVSVWQTRTEIERGRLLPELKGTVLSGDAWWYRAIHLDGYGETEHWPAARKMAFFPLYPMAVRILGVTGDFAIDGILLSNLALLGSLILAGLTARAFGLALDDAERVILYVAFFPTSYFFSLPMTESLFLMLSLGSVLCAKRGRWWIAGVLGGLAALTRVHGLLLAPLLLILCWQRFHRFNLRWLSVLLIPAGTASYMLFLHFVAGSPFAFIQAQEGWSRSPGAFWQPLLEYLSDPTVVSVPWNFVALNFAVAITLLVCAVALFRRGDVGLATYTIVSLLLPLSSGSLQSLARYAAVVFPLHFWLATIGRRPLLDRVILGVFALGLGWLLVLFGMRVDLALA